ncbi:MAG: PAS domain S-box protein [Proteobacteria bacterium]|nr:PAS domain S-box protein [Pseudomonadota bacterium]
MSRPSKAAAASFSIRPYMFAAAVVWTVYNWAFAMFALKQLLNEFPAAANRILLLILAGQCLLWLLGMGGIGLVSRVIKRRFAEQRKSEAALQESEEKFRTIIEQSTDGVILLDEQGVIIEWNQAQEQLTGLAREQALGKPFWEIQLQFAEMEMETPEQHEHLKRVILDAIASGTSPYFGRAMQGVVRQKNGRQKIIQKTFFPIKTGRGIRLGSTIRDVTEQKQSEDALKQSEERLRSFMERANDAIFICDSRGLILFWNRKAEEFYGYTADEILGKPNSIIVPQRFRAEGIGEHKDGHEFNLEASTAILHQGNEKLAVVITRDITERKRYESELREAKEQLDKFLENSIDPIIIADGTGHVVNPNKAFLDMIGYTEEEVLGKPLYSLSVTETGVYESTTGEQVTISEDFFKENISWIEQLIEKGGISGWQSYYMHKSHTVVPITQNIIEIGNNRGEAIGSFSIIRDLTEQRKAEAELRVSEERSRAIAESSIDAIITADTQSKVTFCNPAAERMFGYSAEELIGQPGNMLVAERFRDQDRAGYQHVAQENRSRLAGSPVEACGLKKDNQEFPIEVSVITYKIDDKLYFTSTIHDITERKKMEEQIRQSQKMEAIGTLAGGIAHDFNNILAAIIGFTEMSVQKLEENTSLRRNLEQVLKSSYRARDLVKQILTFSRKSFEERKPVEISPIIKEALKLLRASIPTTIDIKVNINGTAGMVNADPTQIHQVLMNLCTNAAHAMSDTGGVLDISLCPVFLDAREITSYPELQPGAYLQLTIRDSGAGIDPAIIDRIFEPFFTTKEVGQGTGMGLAVVHGIVKSHGGAITVNSKPGKGTTFQILLPKVEEKKEETKDEITTIPKGTECILYIDDEDALVDLGQEMLESLGYRVTAKNNSVEALAAFKTDPHGFDIVITDQTMPAMTGFDLTKQIMHIRPDIPVILCTGHSDQVTREMARDAGIREFVMKPMTIQTLAETVRSALDSRPS